MNVQEFQNKLKEVQEIARQHGNALNAAEIRQVFEECDLDKSQLLGVLKYLTSQGILIEGLETAGEEAKEPEHKKIPLTAEEMATLGIKTERVNIDFAEGDMITVIGGVWTGTAGTIKRIDDNRQTVTINVDMFGRETPVELNFSEVKKMN